MYLIVFPRAALPRESNPYLELSVVGHGAEYYRVLTCVDRFAVLDATATSPASKVSNNDVNLVFGLAKVGG